MTSSIWKLPKRVLGKGGTEVGKCTGATRACSMDGCSGIRISVKWPDGRITRPCSKGMSFSPKGMVATIR